MKKDFRKWAYKQATEQHAPWPLWLRLLFFIIILGAIALLLWQNAV